MRYNKHKWKQGRKYPYFYQHEKKGGKKSISSLAMERLWTENNIDTQEILLIYFENSVALANKEIRDIEYIFILFFVLKKHIMIN